MVKSEKMVRMLDLICERPGELKAGDLARLCDVSERGIYRYLVTLKNAGISVVFNGGGYRAVSMQWHYIFVQKKLTDAIAELVKRGLVRCENEALQVKGKRALAILGA